MKSHFTLVAVFTDETDNGEVLNTYQETHDTEKDCHDVVTDLLEDRADGEILSWIIREVFAEDDSWIVEQGEVGDEFSVIDNNNLKQSVQ